AQTANPVRVSLLLRKECTMSESSSVHAPYLEAAEGACVGVHGLIVIAPTFGSLPEHNSHSLFEDCASLARTFKGRLDGTFHSVGHTALRFRIVDLVGGHEAISTKVERLERRYHDTTFCLMELAGV